MIEACKPRTSISAHTLSYHSASVQVLTSHLLSPSCSSPPGNAYHSAAQSFVQVTSDIQGAYSDVLSGSDIATYGSICALASFSRKELKEQVLNNAEFKKLLDANASNTWKVILQQFYNSNYAKVFEMIEAIKVRRRSRREEQNVEGCALGAAVLTRWATLSLRISLLSLFLFRTISSSTSSCRRTCIASSARFASTRSSSTSSESAVHAAAQRSEMCPPRRPSRVAPSLCSCLVPSPSGRTLASSSA